MAGIESRIGSTSMLSLRLAPETAMLSGSPVRSTSRWYLVPRLARSVGLGPVSSPLFARTLTESRLARPVQAPLLAECVQDTVVPVVETPASAHSCSRRQQVQPEP